MMRHLPLIFLGVLACNQPATTPFINPESAPTGNVNPSGEVQPKLVTPETHRFDLPLGKAFPRFVDALLEARFQITFCHDQLGLISFRQVWREDSEEAHRNHTVEGTLRLRETQDGCVEAYLLLSGRCSQLVTMGSGPRTSVAGLTEANKTDLGPQQRQIIWDILEAACK